MTKNHIKVLAIAGVIALTTSLNAQVVLTKNLPPVGTAYQRHFVVNSNIDGIATPQSGVDVTWDYSALTLNPTNPNITVYDITDMPTSVQSACPNGKYVEVANTGQSNLTDNPFSVYGDEGDYLIRYIDEGSGGGSFNTINDTVFRFNQGFNTIENFNQYGTAMSGNSNTYPYEYAGSGTLKIGSETFTDVAMFVNTTNSPAWSIWNFYVVTPFFHNIAYVRKEQGLGSALFYNKITPATTSVNDVIANSISAVYPNPTNSTLNIEVKETTNIKIVNVLGAIVATQRLNAGNNSINVSELTNGVYFISNDKGGVTKFIKE